VSDQDFFFDEDQPAETASKPAPAKKGGSGTGPARPASGSEQSVSVTIVALVGVVAALLGVIIGLFIGRSMATPAVVAPTGTGAPQQAAPQLSPDQLEGGALPEGHPDIGGGAGGGTAAPDAGAPTAPDAEAPTAPDAGGSTEE